MTSSEKRLLLPRRNRYEYKLQIEYKMLDFNLSSRILKNFENPVENSRLHAQELKAAFVNSFKRFSFQNFKINELVNEMNSRKKRSLCFQRFTSGFYKINVAVSRPTEFNLEQNLHTSGKFRIWCRGIQFQLQCSSIFTGWKYLCTTFSLSSRNLFFVKDCIGAITRFLAAVK